MEDVLNTDSRDFAQMLKDLVDIHFLGKKIVLVMGNLNTHTLSTLYDKFAPAEAARLAKRFDIHHTPQHGSWLNIAEIEINVLVRQCLARRIPDRDTRVRDAAAWQTRRIVPQ